MLKSRLQLSLSVAAIVASGLAAHAQPAPAAIQQTTTAVATVESVDHTTRQVLLSEDNGDLVTVTAGPGVRNLAQVHAGDHLVMSYQQAIAAQLSPPGADLPGPSAQAVAVRAAKGQLPAGAAYTVVDVHVKIVAVDKKTHTVTFTRADGSNGAIVVQTPEMQKFASKLKPGDNVEVAYLQAMSIQVQPAS